MESLNSRNQISDEWDDTLINRTSQQGETLGEFSGGLQNSAQQQGTMDDWEEPQVSEQIPGPSYSSFGRQPMRCHNCNEEGHKSRDCPNGGDSMRGRATGFAQNDGERGAMKCYSCGEEGHFSRDCVESQNGDNGRRRGCFKCGEDGHMARDCVNEASGSNEKERETYIPNEMDGDDLVKDKNENFAGSGINFSSYERIEYEINGASPRESIETFDDLKLEPVLLENVLKCGYKTPTPIQKHASPQLLGNRDIMACAQTGSGKTASFLMPVLHNLLMFEGELSEYEGLPVKPECLIMAPTRELARQIEQEAKIYAYRTRVKVRVLYGGVAVYHHKRNLTSGCNLLVATPGRLRQFLREGVVSLENVCYFILDEADRMLDMGFMDDVKEVVNLMPPKENRVSGMFSATFPTPIQNAAQQFLNNYLFVVIGIIGGACNDVKQDIIPLSKMEKRTKLIEIINDSKQEDKILVFVGSKKGADSLASFLISKQVSSTTIHGDRLQSQREQALNAFVNGKKKVLIATSVAARGLDIPKVAIVVNFDLPSEIEEYVHKIGRTGRLGHTGKAISFYDESQDSGLVPSLVRTLKQAHQVIPEFLECNDPVNITNGVELSSLDIRGQGTYPTQPQVNPELEEDWA